MGTSEYVGNSIDLKFPDNDAKAFADAMKIIIEGTELFEDSVVIKLLTTDATDAKMQPRKENIWAVFKDIAAKANAEDVLVIFMAGQGVTSSSSGTKRHFTI